MRGIRRSSFGTTSVSPKLDRCCITAQAAHRTIRSDRCDVGVINAGREARPMRRHRLVEDRESVPLLWAAFHPIHSLEFAGAATRT